MIKTSELLEKIMIASEESCKCEDENLKRMTSDIFATKKSLDDTVTISEVVKLIRISTDFSRFSSMRTVCKILQDLELIESDVDVLNNDEFRNALSKAFD